MWALLIVAGLVVWIAVQLPVAVLIGRVIAHGQRVHFRQSDPVEPEVFLDISRIDGSGGTGSSQHDSLTKQHRGPRGRVTSVTLKEE